MGLERYQRVHQCCPDRMFESIQINHTCCAHQSQHPAILDTTPMATKLHRVCLNQSPFSQYFNRFYLRYVSFYLYTHITVGFPSDVYQTRPIFYKMSWWIDPQQTLLQIVSMQPVFQENTSNNRTQLAWYEDDLPPDSTPQPT